MALDALGSTAHRKKDLALRGQDGISLLTLLLMKVVLFGIVERGLMTLQAELIPLLMQLYGVYIMAV